MLIETLLCPFFCVKEVLGIYGEYLKKAPTVGIEPLTSLSLGGHHIQYDLKMIYVRWRHGLLWNNKLLSHFIIFHSNNVVIFHVEKKLKLLIKFTKGFLKKYERIIIIRFTRLINCWCNGWANSFAVMVLWRQR